MKFFMLLVLLCSSLFASHKDTINFEELKYKVIKETRKSRLACKMQEYKKKTALRSNLYSQSENLKEHIKNHKHKFKNFIKNIKKKIADKHIDVILLESEDPNILNIAITYKKGRFFNKGYNYVLKDAKYIINSETTNNTDYLQAQIFNEADRDLVQIDINELVAGNYGLNLEIIIEKEFKSKNKKHKSWLNKFTKPIKLSYSFDFEKIKTDSVFLIAEEVFKPEGNWQIGYDFTNSYSEGGEIVNYQFKVFLNNELNFETQTSNNTAYLSFYELGLWRVEITISDTLNDTDTLIFEYDVTNTRPYLDYQYTLNDLGQVELDLSGSFDDGGQVVYYASFFLNDGVFSDYMGHDAIVTRSLKRSGNNTLCAQILDNTEIERVVCRDIYYEGEIGPLYTLESLEQQIFDPRFFFPIQSCSVAEGKTLKEIVYNLTKTDEPGSETIQQRINDVNGLIFFPEPGQWNVEAYCIDSADISSNTKSLSLTVDYDLGKPDAYVELIELDYSIDGRLYAPSIENSIPSPFANYITEYKYTARKLNSTETFNLSFSYPFPDIEFPSYGTWEITYTVIDDLGIESDPFIFNQEVIRKLINPIVNNVSIIKQDGDTTDLNYTVNNEIHENGSANITEYIFQFNKRDSEESFRLIETQPYIGFSFPSFGIWDLAYKIKNADNLYSNTVNLTFNVEARLPEANVTLAQKSGDETGLVYTVTNENSTIGSGSSINSYNYNFNNLEKNISFDLNTDNRYPDIVFPDEGNWTVTYKVINDLNLESLPYVFNLNIEIPNKEPVAVFQINTDPTEPNILKINSNSYDEDGEIVEYQFRAVNLDSGVVTENTFTHSNTIPTFTVELDYGYYNVEIIAIDDDGERSAIFTQNIQITNSKPVANFFVTKQNDQGSYTFNAINSSDVDGYIVSYEYRLHSPSGTQTILNSNEPILTYQFVERGLWSAELTVMDNYGNLSGSYYQGFEVDIPNISPIAILNCTTTAGELTCDASGSYDEDGNIVNYILYLGTKSYQQNTGLFEIEIEKYDRKIIKLEVVDNESSTGSSSPLILDLSPAINLEAELNCSVDDELSGLTKIKCSLIYDERLSLQNNIIWYLNEKEVQQSNDYYEFIPRSPIEYSIRVELPELNQTLTQTIDLKENDEFNLDASTLAFYTLPTNTSTHSLNDSVQIASSHELESIEIKEININNCIKSDTTQESNIITIPDYCLEDGLNNINFYGFDNEGYEFNLDLSFFAGKNSLTINTAQFSKVNIYALDLQKPLEIASTSSLVYNLPNSRYVVITTTDSKIITELVNINSDQSITLESNLDIISNNFNVLENWKVKNGFLESKNIFDYSTESLINVFESIVDNDGIFHASIDFTDFEDSGFTIRDSSSLEKGDILITVVKNHTTQKHSINIESLDLNGSQPQITSNSESNKLGADVILIKENLIDNTQASKFDYNILNKAYAITVSDTTKRNYFKPQKLDIVFDLSIHNHYNVRDKKDLSEANKLAYFSLPKPLWDEYLDRTGTNQIKVKGGNLNKNKIERGANPIALKIQNRNEISNLDIQYFLKFLFRSEESTDSSTVPVKYETNRKIFTMQKDQKNYETLNLYPDGTGDEPEVIQNMPSDLSKVRVYFCYTRDLSTENRSIFNCDQEIGKELTTLIPYSSNFETFGKHDNDKGGGIYVTHETDLKLKEIRKDFPELRINDCSKLNGGRFPGHNSHTNGLNCDLSFSSPFVKGNYSGNYVETKRLENPDIEIAKSVSIFRQNNSLASKVSEFFNSKLIKLNSIQQGNHMPIDKIYYTFNGNKHLFETTIINEDMEYMNYLNSLKLVCNNDLITFEPNNKNSQLSLKMSKNNEHKNHFHVNFNNEPINTDYENYNPSNLTIPEYGIDYTITSIIEGTFSINKLNPNIHFYAKSISSENVHIFEIDSSKNNVHNLPDYNDYNIYIVKRDSKLNCKETRMNIDTSLLNLSRFHSNFRNLEIKLSVFTNSNISDFLQSNISNIEVFFTNQTSEAPKKLEFPMDSKSISNYLKGLDNNLSLTSSGSSYYFDINFYLDKSYYPKNANVDIIKVKINYKNGLFKEYIDEINFGDLQYWGFSQNSSNGLYCLSGYDNRSETQSVKYRRYFSNEGTGWRCIDTQDTTAATYFTGGLSWPGIPDATEVDVIPCPSPIENDGSYLCVFE
tara:strand:- start:44846 stop:51346 length:6501 start_codon:yes stop_codon:yes gene_type:complete